MSSPPSVDETSPAAKGAELHEVPCYLCGEEQQVLLHEKPPFKIVQCPKCDLVYTTPRCSGDELREMYQTDYWQSESAKDFGYTDYLADEADYLKTFRMRSQVITERFEKPGKLLEVGSAAGYFLKVMKDQGWDVTGVEISEHVTKQARERFELDPIHVGTLEEVQPELDAGGYDVVCFWDVIEHLVDPAADLKRAHALLKDDGLLLIETQNVASRFAKLLGAKWHHFKYLEHLYHFSPKTVAKMLDDCGYEVIRNTGRYGGKHVSYGFIRERTARIHSLMPKLLFPLKWIANRSLYLNLFDEMIVLAKKK